MKRSMILIAMVALSLHAQAQSGTDIQDGESRTQIQSADVPSETSSRHQLVLDFVPTLIANGAKGLGVSYHYGLLSKLSVGAFASGLQSDKFSTSYSRDIDWTMAMTGVESKFFLQEFGQGVYLGAAATYFYVKGEGVVRDNNGVEASVEDDADKFGYLAKLGYAFKGNTLKNGSVFVIDFALNYGTGNSFEYSTVSAGGLGSMRIREIRDSLGFYGGLGILF